LLATAGRVCARFGNLVPGRRLDEPGRCEVRTAGGDLVHVLLPSGRAVILARRVGSPPSRRRVARCKGLHDSVNADPIESELKAGLLAEGRRALGSTWSTVKRSPPWGIGKSCGSDPGGRASRAAPWPVASRSWTRCPHPRHATVPAKPIALGPQFKADGALPTALCPRCPC